MSGELFELEFFLFIFDKVCEWHLLEFELWMICIEMYLEFMVWDKNHRNINVVQFVRYSKSKYRKIQISIKMIKLRYWRSINGQELIEKKK